MRNAKDMTGEGSTRILSVGRTGAGKTAQALTLPGKKFAYIFDPNSIRTLAGADIDIEEFYPDILELDATLKGFNKNANSDKPASEREPTTYNKWVDDINEKVEAGFFQAYDWLIFDSITFLTKATMDRQLYINNRYGEVEDRADYKIVGSKLSDVFNSIVSLPLNIYCTGHIATYENEKTHRIETSLNLPGSARSRLPLLFTEIWQAVVEENKKGDLRYYMRTRPDPKGLLDIRSSIPDLETLEDVTIEDMKNPQKYGIGALLTRHSH